VLQHGFDAAALQAYLEGAPIYAGNAGNVQLIAPGPNPCGLGGDAGCSTADLDALYAVLGTSVPPTDAVFDLNSDNVVDAADLNEWLSLAATENGHGSPYLRGDTELDRDVDITDFNTLASNFAPDGYGASSVVPEPSSFILCVFGILAVSRFVSRREVG